ncbi:Kae1-associated serine/threonine protein kinase [archaeon]|nr:MAG: Kae1-associated serine/threonine protein kinase [archaeon]
MPGNSTQNHHPRSSTASRERSIARGPTARTRSWRSSMWLINQGAEAKLYHMTGQEYCGVSLPYDLVVKERVRKRYRIPPLDSRIVLSRTIHEARLLHEAKRAGVHTPTLFFIDTTRHAIVMEHIEGTRVKERLLDAPRTSLDLVVRIGADVGRLHAHGIVHGDLTTSNLILRDGDVVFIDFGLGEFSPDVEPQAVDLHLFKQALMSTHYEMTNSYWERFLEGYKTTMPASDEIIERIADIEQRGRYVERGEQQ